MYDIINIISQKYTRYNRSEYRDFEIEKVLINENIIEACDELVVIIRNNIYVLRHIIDKTEHEIEISKEQYKVRIFGNYIAAYNTKMEDSVKIFLYHSGKFQPTYTARYFKGSIFAIRNTRYYWVQIHMVILP